MQLIDHFARAARRYPDRAAFVQPDGSVTRYAAAWDAVEAAARHLLAAGLEPGARVAILSPNDASAFIAMLATIRAGFVWISLNTRNTTADNAALATMAGARALLFHPDLDAEADRLCAMLPTLALCRRLDRLASAADHPLPDLPDDDGRPCAIFATGGTTGRSKGAVWTNRTWEALIANFWTCAPPCDHPVHLCVAPITHGAGALAFMLMPRAATNVLLTTADPLAILQAIERNRVTHLFLPPTVLYALLSSPHLGAHDTSSLIFFLISAAPVAPEKLREAVAAFGPVICQSFGQAEAPFFLTYLSAEDHVRALASDADAGLLRSCGRATMFSRVEIMDETGRLLAPGETGEIVARGALVTPGYHDDPAATAAVSAFGWHHTGDIGLKDEAGYLYIVDRSRDMIITGGFNVYSTEVEAALLEHAAVLDCAVVGVPDARWGEAVKAVVELKAGAACDPAALIAHCKARLGGVKAPKTIDIWDNLPRSAVGKVLKRTIRDRFWDGRDRRV